MSATLSHCTVKLLTLLIDFAKPAIYISKFLFNKLFFKLTLQMKSPCTLFSQIWFLGSIRKNIYCAVYINRSLKCRDEAMACNLFCPSSGAVLIHLHKKSGVQSSVMPHQNQLDLSADRRRRQGSMHSLLEALVHTVPSVRVVSHSDIFSAAVVSLVLDL